MEMAIIRKKIHFHMKKYVLFSSSDFLTEKLLFLANFTWSENVSNHDTNESDQEKTNTEILSYFVGY